MSAIDKTKMKVNKTRKPRKKLAEFFLEKNNMYACDHNDCVKIVDDIFKYALLQSAADIHIERNENGNTVRYRIDGMLHDVMRLDAKTGIEVANRIKHLANMTTDKTDEIQEGRISLEGDTNGMMVWVGIFPYLFGEKIVMRIFHPFTKGMTLEKLGMQEEILEKVHCQIRKQRGTILITGPIGSGTTTTAYTLIDILNSPSKSISTIEDPVEHRMLRIQQMQINPNIGIDFPSCLNSLLKQDNDILMIGEIRDNQTLRGIVRAASWRNLVVAIMHAQSSFHALEIIREMDIDPFEIAANVHSVISQRLARRLCQNCKIAYTINEKQVKKFSQVADFEKLKNRVWYKSGEGCNKCGSTGYAGKIGIFEILEIDDVIGRLIFLQAPLADISAKAREKGMRTLNEDALVKASSGLISLEEVHKALTVEGMF